MREELRMATALYSRVLATALLLLAGCAQTIAFPTSKSRLARSGWQRSLADRPRWTAATAIAATAASMLL
jgi:outer membrane biogenesis lipoprotein LolB